MKAIVLDRAVRFVADAPEPAPGPLDALIRVTKAGICGTDLELAKGYKGFRGVPGHEFVGAVLACATRPDLVGRRVVGEINAACGACATCVAGRRAHCPSRRVLGILGMDGAFAERCALPAANLHVVPEKVSDDEAVFAEPLAAACRIVEQVRLPPKARVAVLGPGRLGTLCAAVLRTEGADVTLVGRNDAASPGFDVVVEATGSPGGFRRARELVRPLGTIVLKSTCAGAGSSVDLTQVVVDEVTIVGSRCGPLDRALRMLVARRFDVTKLVAARYPLDRGAAAFEHAARPGAGKVLFDVA